MKFFTAILIVTAIALSVCPEPAAAIWPFSPAKFATARKCTATTCPRADVTISQVPPTAAQPQLNHSDRYVVDQSVPDLPVFDPVAQEHAQREVEIMSAKGQMGHFLGVAPGCRFSGVGMSTDGSNIPTCQPSEDADLRCVADASTYCWKRGVFFRSRHWK